MSSNNDNKSSTNSVDNLESLRRSNFDGKIPIKLVLAQTSLSSALMPQPRYILLSRQTFLHIGLESSVRKLHEYALPTLSFLGNQQTNKTKNAVVVVQEDDDSDSDDNGDDDDGEETSRTLTGQDPKCDASSDNSSMPNTAEISGKNNSSSDTKTTDEKENANDNNECSACEPNELPPYPLCWFEDVATGHPLRWQYFAGVLFDSLHCSSSTSSLQEQHQQLSYQHQNQNLPLPWEIRLHFRSYPSQQLLEVCDPSWGHSGTVLDTLKEIFRNSLKQGFVIRYGNSKEALNLSKLAHETIWEGICKSRYAGIASVVHRDDEFEFEFDKNNNNSTKTTTTKATAEPKANADGEANKANAKTSEPPETEHPTEDDAVVTNDSPKEAEEEEQQQIESNSNINSESNSKVNHKTNNLVMVPVRLSIDPTKPMVQKRCEGGTAASAATLGSLLLEWVPSHFTNVETSEAKTSDSEIEIKSRKDSVQPRSEDVSWSVAGLSPPLSTPLLDLWLALRHPDNFLYISLSIPNE